MDHVEKDILDAHISFVIQALLDVGDALIDPADERGMFDFGNVSRASRCVYHLLKRLAVDQRAGVLEAAIRAGSAVAVQSRLLNALDEEVRKARDSNEVALLGADEVIRLKTVWLDRLRAYSDDASFLDHPELPTLLATWKRWAEGTEVRAWCERITASDERLLILLSKFLQYTKSQTMGDWAVRLKPRLNPSWLECYIDPAAVADRIRRLQNDGLVPDESREAVTQYLKEFEILKSGKNPDGFDAFDD